MRVVERLHSIGETAARKHTIWGALPSSKTLKKAAMPGLSADVCLFLSRGT